MRAGRRLPREGGGPAGDAFTWQWSDVAWRHRYSGTAVTGDPVTAMEDLGSEPDSDMAPDLGSPAQGTIGSAPAVVFTDDSLLANLVDVAQPCTYAGIHRMDNSGNDGFFVDTVSGTLAIRYEQSNGRLYVDLNGSFGAEVEGFSVVIGQSFSIVVLCNGTSTRVWVNGTERTIDTTGFGSANVNSLVLGGMWGANHADNTCAEAALISGSLSAQTIADIETWRGINA